MFYNTGFSYNGIHSSTYGVGACQVGKSAIEGQFGISRSLITEKTRNASSSILLGNSKDNLKFTLELYCENWTDTIKNNVIQWLFNQDEDYKPLISDDNTGIVYYCMPVGDCKKNFFNVSSGYITVNFECNAPWGFTPINTITQTVTTTKNITINNTSNIVKWYYPEIEFTLAGSADITICNTSLSPMEYTIFEGLNTTETIYLYGERQQIISSTGLYRYNKHNGNFLRLKQGNNIIGVIGACSITIRTQYPIIIF